MRKNWELIGSSLLINAFSCESQGEEALVSGLAHVIREEMSLHRGRGIYFDEKLEGYMNKNIMTCTNKLFIKKTAKI